MAKARVALLAVALGAAILPSITRADGCALPRYGSLKPLPIPGQQAILVFTPGVDGKSGREVLAVWNTLETKEDTAAWILPLPAAPDKIQTCSPLAFQALAEATAPRVRVKNNQHPLAGIFVALLWIAGLVILAMGRKGAGWGACFLFAIIILVMGTGSFNAGVRGGSGRGIQILSRQAVGRYDTTVLKAADPAALDAWLRENGFAILGGTQGEGAVKQYISKVNEVGWNPVDSTVEAWQDAILHEAFSDREPGKKH